MNKIHLSPEQRAALVATLARYTSRPTSAQYDREHRNLRRIHVTGKRQASKPANTVRGYEAGDVKLLPGFDATRDLAPGWAVVSRYDSGGNHSITNAAEHVWRSLWNAWGSHDGDGLSLARAIAARNGEWAEAARSLVNAEGVSV